MPRRYRTGKARRSQLTFAEKWHLLTGFQTTRGVSQPFGPFASEGDRREAWEGHADDLLESHDAGQRPWAWFLYECDIDLPHFGAGSAFEDQWATYLAEHDLLAPWERHELERLADGPGGGRYARAIAVIRSGRSALHQ